MKIALINPPFYRLKRLYVPYLPLSLQYLAAVLKQQSHDVEIFNCDGPDINIPAKKVLLKDKVQGQEYFIKALDNDDHIVWQEFKQYFKQYQPDVIIITATSPIFPAAKKLAHLVKEADPKCITIMGGMHPTLCYEEVLKKSSTDFVVMGEGEETLCELVDAIKEHGRRFTEHADVYVKGIAYFKKAECVVTASRGFIPDIDALPFPARETVVNSFPGHIDKKSIITMRGCVYGCPYCNSSQMWHRTIRFRSSEKIIEEMNRMHERYGISLFDFKDETFTINRERIIRLCSLMRQLKFKFGWVCSTRIDVIDKELIAIMGRANCVGIRFGIESGSKNTSEKICKEFSLDQVLDICSYVKQRGMQLNINMMIGLPFEKESDMRETQRLINTIKPHSVFLTIYLPLPKTEFNSGESQIIIEDTDWKYYSFHSPYNFFIQNSMEKADFDKLRDEIIKTADHYNANQWSEYLSSIVRGATNKLENVLMRQLT